MFGDVPVIAFDFGGEVGEVTVYRVCPDCSRFLNAKNATATVTLMPYTQVKFTGMVCAKHGDVQPAYGFY